MNEDELLDLLALMFDAYEEGPDCYEDPDECAGHIGKAVHLDDATFDRIADILNLRRPRNVGAGTTATEGHNGEVRGASRLAGEASTSTVVLERN